MTTTMTYGTYNFTPVPLISINKNYLKTEDGTRLGTLFILTLNGTLTPIPGTAGGLNETMALTNTMRNAFNQEGCPFVIQCNSDILWSGHPRIGDINFDQSSDSWAQTIPYTVELEFDTEASGDDPSLTPPYIQSASEEWLLEFSEETSKFSLELPSFGTDTNPYVLSMSHNVQAKGTRHYTDCDTVTKEPWQYAKDYVKTKLNNGTGSAFQEQLAATGIINLNITDFNAYNHMRTQSSDIAGGGYSVSENWLVMNTGAGIPGNSIEDFTVDVQQNNEDDKTIVSVGGSVQGVETRDYGSTSGAFSITEDKYTAASGYWGVVKSRLLNRAQLIHTDALTNKTHSRALNIIPISITTGHNPSKGTITYSYTYDDRPSNCITGALSEAMSIQDNNPTDVFAEIVVLGRQLGPVLQDINTITASTKDISIEVIGSPATGCTAALLGTVTNNMKTDIATLLCSFETELTGVYNQVFKNADTESWNPKEGRYSRNVGWTYQSCSVTGNTSLC